MQEKETSLQTPLLIEKKLRSWKVGMIREFRSTYQAPQVDTNGYNQAPMECRY